MIHSYNPVKSDIILDRDGVINIDSDEYVKSSDEWIPIDGSINAIAALHKAGHRVFVATNQSGIGRGYFSLNTLTSMHDKLHQLVNKEGGSLNDLLNGNNNVAEAIKAPEDYSISDSVKASKES